MSNALIETVVRGLDAEFPGDWDNIPTEDMARAAIAAIEAAGYRIVPVEPTLSQCGAGENAIRNIPQTGVVPRETEMAQECYAAMLAAAPKVIE